MPKEYIERDMVLSHKWEVRSYDPSDPDPVTEVVSVSSIMCIPAADVVEVRYCRFSLEEVRRRESVYKCSACGNYLTVRADTLNGGRGDMNYCPFCGRKVLHKGQDGGHDE